MEETAFAIGAVCVAAAIIGGGLKAANLWEIPAFDSVPRQFLLGSFGVALIAWSILSGMGDGEEPPPNGDPSGVATEAPSATREVPPSVTTGPGPSGAGGCQITTANPLVTLMEPPDTFSQEIGPVPAGVYPVEAVENVAFGPQTQRWLRITVNGRTGWVQDNTFNVASKTAACT